MGKSWAVDVPVEREGGIRIGRESAPVVVMVFTDYTCSHCGTLHGELLEALRKSHVGPGKVALEIRHLPRLDEKSLGLVRAALAAERAIRGNQADAAEGNAAVGTKVGEDESEGKDEGTDKREGAKERAEEGAATRAKVEREEKVAAKAEAAAVDWRVWEFQKALFEFAGVLPEKAFPALAAEKGIDEEAFRAAWDAVDVREELLVDADLAEAVGLTALPAIVVFPNLPGKPPTGVMLEGETAAAALVAEIEKVAASRREP